MKSPANPRPRILIFIVAYNAAQHLEKVLNRIPPKIFTYDYEILIIDDSSRDQTFAVGKCYQLAHAELKINLLSNPDNQGYGGNQKLGYRYAIQNNFDIVVLLHGDGQYPPELIEPLIQPILHKGYAAVFGSRFLKKWSALRGGMPLYKFIGNRILTAFQNLLLHTSFSEFHSGYRAYAVQALAKIPFERNSNDFHFDTQIIIQLIIAKYKIKELAIPTYYGSEICYVNGLHYAWQVMKTTLLSKIHQMSILYQREYDIPQPQGPEYDLKLGYRSSHTMAIAAIPSGSKVLDIGCNRGYLGHELKTQKKCFVAGIDSVTSIVPDYLDQFTRLELREIAKLPLLNNYDHILLLDLLEHLENPETFLDKLRENSKSKQPKFIITVPNIAFVIIRLQLLFGNFNYGRQGILDHTHHRLFTFGSIQKLLADSSFKITKLQGIPAPFPKALGNNFLSKLFMGINIALIYLRKELFSYQIYLEATPYPVVKELLSRSITYSKNKKH